MEFKVGDTLWLCANPRSEVIRPYLSDDHLTNRKPLRVTIKDVTHALNHCNGQVHYVLSNGIVLNECTIGKTAFCCEMLGWESMNKPKQFNLLKIKEIFFEKWYNHAFATDSDLEDFVEEAILEYHGNKDDINPWQWLGEYRTFGTLCQGCAFVQCFPDSFECTSCTRNTHNRKDRYKPYN